MYETHTTYQWETDTSSFELYETNWNHVMHVQYIPEQFTLVNEKNEYDTLRIYENGRDDYIIVLLLIKEDSTLMVDSEDADFLEYSLDGRGVKEYQKNGEITLLSDFGDILIMLQSNYELDEVRNVLENIIIE